ncbi:amidohydrolase family protein [Flavivirga aquimarina]|uniref:Amidohydrolase family protein n=1 Tax=Flavivirga aquimarina TaxID=2027862 RepID=A0ABT8W6S1_9FLAO|nr:amidohydrolase family protein [Flavivirga aquimarina]MDO5968818.1 amidohydrolase family protein [Flavivirga aquimarina]
MRTPIHIIKLVILFLLFNLSYNCNKKEDSTDTEEETIVNYEKYKDIFIVDIHNHDASGYKYQQSLVTWTKYGIDKIVLFGDISEPSAITTDEIAFEAYEANTDRFFPFIAGINIFDTSCLTYIRERFTAGVYGIGEVAAASTNSPVVSNLPWKGEHPLDGYFSEIYDLCAEFKKPILLHIDPPSGFPITKLKEAATLYPDTNFIFGHANAYNSPSEIESLIAAHDNIYIDFFAGFTAYNKDSNFKLENYVALIKKYPLRFMVSSDSGYGITYDQAYLAIFELFELLDTATVEKIAGQNFLGLINNN